MSDKTHAELATELVTKTLAANAITLGEGTPQSQATNLVKAYRIILEGLQKAPTRT